MENHYIDIDGVPAILWGKPSHQLFLYIHGQGGNKEEAALFSKIVCQRGVQVLSIDLPEHGERIAEKNSFDPWHIVPELKMIMNNIKNSWEDISLCANSIGAWFSMLSFYYRNKKARKFWVFRPKCRYSVGINRGVYTFITSFDCRKQPLFR